MKISMVMPDDLVLKADEAAKALNISRSAFICMAVSQKVQQDTMIGAVPEMLEFIKKFQSLEPNETEKQKKLR